MRKMEAIHLLLLLLLALTHLTLPTSACHFPTVFNFGDSNSDTGGLSAAFGQAPAPNGETFFARPAGRYCDGRLIIDFIAESLKLPLLHSYLDSIGSNFSGGANFATAGSTIRRQNSTLFQSGFSPFSLDVQSWQFSQFKGRSQFYFGSSSSSSSSSAVFRRLLPPETAFSAALYTFDVGMNDLTSSLFANQSVDQVRAAIPLILEDFSTVVKSVYYGGGRYFWVHNAGPIGCLAYVLERLPVAAKERDSAGCATAYNGLAMAFNEQLKSAVAALREALPDVALSYVDVYAAKYSLFSNPPRGFTERPLVACCGHGGEYNYSAEWGCGIEKEVNNTHMVLSHSCPDPTRRVVWDGVHYTEAANRWVFQRISSGAFSDPPLPLAMACVRQPSSS